MIAVDCWLSRVVECNILEAASLSTPSYKTLVCDGPHPTVTGSLSSIDSVSSSTREQGQFKFTCPVRSSILHFYCCSSDCSAQSPSALTLQLKIFDILSEGSWSHRSAEGNERHVLICRGQRCGKAGTIRNLSPRRKFKFASTAGQTAPHTNDHVPPAVCDLHGTDTQKPSRPTLSWCLRMSLVSNDRRSEHCTSNGE